jgi:hypothetical protein
MSLRTRQPFILLVSEAATSPRMAPVPATVPHDGRSLGGGPLGPSSATPRCLVTSSELNLCRPHTNHETRDHAAHAECVLRRRQAAPEVAAGGYRTPRAILKLRRVSCSLAVALGAQPHTASDPSPSAHRIPVRLPDDGPNAARLGPRNSVHAARLPFSPPLGHSRGVAQFPL